MRCTRAGKEFCCTAGRLFGNAGEVLGLGAVEGGAWTLFGGLGGVMRCTRAGKEFCCTAGRLFGNAGEVLGWGAVEGGAWTLFGGLVGAMRCTEAGNCQLLYISLQQKLFAKSFVAPLEDLRLGDAYQSLGWGAVEVYEELAKCRNSGGHEM